MQSDNIGPTSQTLPPIYSTLPSFTVDCQLRNWRVIHNISRWLKTRTRLKNSRLREMRMAREPHETREVHTLPSLAVIVSISSPVWRKSKHGGENMRIKLFLPYLGSGFFSSSSILTHGSAPGCCSDLRQDSYHGNVEERNINNRLPQRERETERPSQTKLRHEAFPANGETSQPMAEESLLTDSCRSQSERVWAGQNHLVWPLL